MLVQPLCVQQQPKATSRVIAAHSGVGHNLPKFDEIFTSHTPPDQWITNVIVPLPKKGDLSLMTNYSRGIP